MLQQHTWCIKGSIRIRIIVVVFLFTVQSDSQILSSGFPHILNKQPKTMWIFPATFWHYWKECGWGGVTNYMRIMCSQHFKLQFEDIMYAFTGCGLSACYRFDLFAELSGKSEVSAYWQRFHKENTVLHQPKLMASKVCLRISWVAFLVNGENRDGAGTNGWPSGKTIKLEVYLTSCIKMNSRWIKDLNVKKKKVWQKKILSGGRYGR